VVYANVTWNQASSPARGRLPETCVWAPRGMVPSPVDVLHDFPKPLSWHSHPVLYTPSTLTQVAAHAVMAQVPGPMLQVVAAVWFCAGQSDAEQQFALGMQEFEAMQVF